MKVVSVDYYKAHRVDISIVNLGSGGFFSLLTADKILAQGNMTKHRIYVGRTDGGTSILQPFLKYSDKKLRGQGSHTNKFLMMNLYKKLLKIRNSRLTSQLVRTIY